MGWLLKDISVVNIETLLCKDEVPSLLQFLRGKARNRDSSSGDLLGRVLRRKALIDAG